MFDVAQVFRSNNLLMSVRAVYHVNPGAVLWAKHRDTDKGMRRSRAVTCRSWTDLECLVDLTFEIVEQ